jgi:2',3'-cyclic-nucleotide 2'-phosphodiesterase/3'-nucleotidase
MNKSDEILNRRQNTAKDSDTNLDQLCRNLRILTTTDLHMHLTSHDYYADRADPTVGLTRTASLIHAARVEAEQGNICCLLMDNGDGLQGTPMGEVAMYSQGQPHPLMQAFAHLQYDAIGLGNHDFNFGLEALDAALADAPCPVICSNLHRVGEVDQTQPFTIIERMIQIGDTAWPIRIGVVSFLPSHTLRWDAHLLEGRIEIDDILDSARHHVGLLHRERCDLIIALAHTGLGPIRAQPGMENAAIPLADIDGIDVLITGHTHLHLPGPEHAGLEYVDSETASVHGKPAIMAGSAGTHLGVIDLELQRSPLGKWKVANHQSALRPIARYHSSGKTVSLVAEDPKLTTMLAPYHDATSSHMRQPVGYSDQPRHSYFTFFAQDQALTLVAAAQAAALRPMLKDTEIATLPLLSATAPGKFGGRAGPQYYTNVPAGPLSLRHLADLYIFPNTLHAVIMTGAQVLEWLEQSASLFHQVAPGSEEQNLINPGMAGYYFDVLHGLEYCINLSVPPRFWPDGQLRHANAHRIVSPTFQGACVRADQKFVVALNNYRAVGGGNVAVLNRAHSVLIPRLSIRDALRDYVGSSEQNDPLSSAPAPWRFSSMPGTFVITTTSPDALAHMSELCDRDVVATGTNSDGFLTLRLGL